MDDTRFSYVPLAVVTEIIRREGIGPVRDLGLLSSALARPQTTVLGQDAYADLPTKSGAMLHSLCANHALVDGNKRLAAIITLVFLGLNGARSTLDNDGLFTLIMDVAAGRERDPATIGRRLRVGPAQSRR